MNSTARRSLRTLYFALAVVAGAALIRAFILEGLVVEGSSMEPSLLAGDLVLVNRVVYRPWSPSSARKPKRGAIVVVGRGREKRQRVAKRIVAVGGDTIAMRDGVVFLNGQQQEESFAIRGTSRDADVQMLWQLEHLSPGVNADGYFPTISSWGPIVVPEGQLMLLGDHRDQSIDSRTFGPVNVADVRGRVDGVLLSVDNRDGVRIRWGRIGPI